MVGNTSFKSLDLGTIPCIPLESVALKFSESHHAVMALVAQHSDTELFTKGTYGWTGTAHLASYFNSGSCSHYDWALKLLRKTLKYVPSKV